MAKMPTMDEWAERLGNKAINEYVYEGRTLKEWIDLMASGRLVILPNNATNGDVIKAICPMWIAYHDTDIEVTVDKKVWNAPYKKVDMANAIRKGTELKQGKWQKTGLIDKVACSNCKSQLWDITRDEVLKYKYCPNCGAKMEVENDS